MNQTCHFDPNQLPWGIGLRPALLAQASKGYVQAGSPTIPGYSSTWYIFGFEEAQKLLAARTREPELRMAPISGDKYAKARAEIWQHLGGWPLFQNPPEHTAQKRTFLPYFNQESVKYVSKALQHNADLMMREMLHNNQKVIDIQESLVFPLAIQAICMLIGMPALEVDWLKKRTRAFVNFLDLGYTEAAYLPCQVALQEMQARMCDIIRSGQVINGSWLDSLVKQSGKIASEFEDASIVALMMQILFAGQETVGDTIGNAVYRFSMDPEQLAILYRHPELMDNAVEEILRYENPVNFLGTRVLDEAITLNDVRLEANSPTIVVLWTCNRDGRRYVNADQFDIQRSFAGSQLSFGHGLHTCIGMHLARLLIRIVLNTLIKHIPQPWELADAPVWRENMIFSGPLSLSLKLG